MLTEAPVYVSWNYTYACNFNCEHCYSRADWYPEELDTPGYERIARQLIDAGVLHVGFGGGEPLSRRDCVHILDVLGQAHVETNITTNAWFLDDRRVEELAAARLGKLYVSVDSADPASHDSFRRKQGSFDRVEAGIRRAVEAGHNVVFSTVVTSKNVHELSTITALGESWGITGIEFKRFRPTGNGLAMADVLPLSSGEQVGLHGLLNNICAASPLDIALIYNAESEGGGAVDSGCPCGVRSLTLRPNGDVASCAYSPGTLGNLTKDDIGELWRESPVLAAMRAAPACAGLKPAKAPSQGNHTRPPLTVSVA